MYKKNSKFKDAEINGLRLVGVRQILSTESSDLCVVGANSRNLSNSSPKNSSLTGNSLLTGYISIISPLLLHVPSCSIVACF